MNTVKITFGFIELALALNIFRMPIWSITGGC